MTSETPVFTSYLNDHTFDKIKNRQDADYILQQLDHNHPRLDVWQQWAEPIMVDHNWFKGFYPLMLIAYARMAHRQGSLSIKPRSYHNEFHCNDLLMHLIECQQRQPEAFTAEALALISYFAVCHDLQQGLPKQLTQNELAGSNEIASFKEAYRLIEDAVKADNNLSHLWDKRYLLLLKVMIEGSTFGAQGQSKRYFFQGNRIRPMVAQMKLTKPQDIEWAYFACDIDTANVSLNLVDYAQSALRVFDELKTQHLSQISARHFFSTEQLNFFFEQQQFHSKLAKQLFLPQKEKNAPLLRKMAAAVAALPENADTDTVKHTFINAAKQLDPL